MKTFARIYIEISNICNLECSFCIGNQRPPKIMTPSEFEHIIYKIKPYVKQIYLHVLGEPLMHPNFAQILQICETHQMLVNITTNGTLLKANQNLLINSPVVRKVSISLHSLENATFDQMQQYLQDVANFALNFSQAQKYCELRLWNLGAENTQNNHIFTTLCQLLNLTNSQTLLDNINQKGNATLLPNLFMGKAERFSWPSLQNSIVDKPIFCYALRNQLAILCDGTVVPCCLDSNGDINLGNIFTQTLPTILNSSRAKNLYNGFSNRKASEELCQKCSYATRF